MNHTEVLQRQHLQQALIMAQRLRAHECRRSSDLPGADERLKHIDDHIASLEKQINELGNTNA